MNKKVIPIVLLAALLSGCHVHTKGPAASAGASSPAASVPRVIAMATANPSTPVPTLSAIFSAQPTLPATLAPSISVDATPSPSASAAATPSPKPFDPRNMTGKNISATSVTNGKIAYYRKDGYDEDTNQEYTQIYRYSAATGKTAKVLSSKGLGYIAQLFVDDDGTLFYTLAEDSDACEDMSLFKFNDGKSTQITDGIAQMLLSEKGMLYCCVNFDLDTETPSGFVSIDLQMGIKTELDDSDPLIDRLTYGQYEIEYSNVSGTDFQITDTASGTEKDVQVDTSMQDIEKTFVQGNVLFVVDCDFDAQKSTIYRIDINKQKILSAHIVNGEIDGSAFCNGKWYFFVWQASEDENPVNQRIDVCDLSSGKVSLYEKVNALDDHLEKAELETGCGYIWVFECASGDGLYQSFKFKVAIR